MFDKFIRAIEWNVVITMLGYLFIALNLYGFIECLYFRENILAISHIAVAVIWFIMMKMGDDYE